MDHWTGKEGRIREGRDYWVGNLAETRLKSFEWNAHVCTSIDNFPYPFPYLLVFIPRGLKIFHFDFMKLSHKTFRSKFAAEDGRFGGSGEGKLSFCLCPIFVLISVVHLFFGL